VKRSLLIGCVAENTPKYLAQALRLVQSVRWFGGSIADADVLVCVVGTLDSATIERFSHYGATLRTVERFDARCPVTNKLRFVEQPEARGYSGVLMLDCDTIVVQDFSPLLTGSLFSAKIADGPTMPLDVLAHVFRQFDIPCPEPHYRCTIRGTLTIPYFNTGVLYFPVGVFDILPPIWIRHTRELLSRFDLVRGREHFVEQTSMSMALASSALSFTPLGNEMNCPVHHEDYIPCLDGVDPYIIHYHSRVDGDGYLLPSKYGSINRRIRQFNERLASERQRGVA